MPQLNPFETELLTTQYTTALELLLQQKVSKLRGLVDSGAHVGKQASPIQQIAPLEFKAAGARYSPIQFQLAQFTRRWVYPTDKELGVPIDKFDQLKTIVSPQPGITMAVSAAANRFFDDVIIAAAFASATTGVDSSTVNTETWPATTFLVADTFDSQTSIGLSYAKLVEGRRILQNYQNDLDAETVTVACGSQQNSDLLKAMEVVDSDWKTSGAVERGMVRDILGCQIVHSERLQTSVVSGNTVRNVIMFVRSGMYLGIWKDMEIYVDERKDLVGRPWQLYAMLSAGATRTQLGKVIQINCFDTTGSDPTAP